MLLLKRKTFEASTDSPLVRADEAAAVARAEEVVAAAENEAAAIVAEAKAAYEAERKRGYEDGIAEGREEILRQKAKRAVEANRVFRQAFPALKGGDARTLFRMVSLPRTSGRGPEIERDLLSHGLRVCHSDRFHVGHGADAPFLRISLSSCGSTAQLKRALARLAETVPRQNG